MSTSGIKMALTSLITLAQADGGGAAGAAGENADPGIMPMIPMLVMFGLLFYFIMLRPQQREQKERQKKLDALKKNDKVLTIGGIIGSIVDLSSDGKRVTLKVDDGTRIKFTRGSIQGVYDESE